MIKAAMDKFGGNLSLVANQWESHGKRFTIRSSGMNLKAFIQPHLPPRPRYRADGGTHLPALEKEWGWFLFLGIGWLAALRGISLLFKRNAQKVAFMFDAIDNSDYAFKYATRGRSSNDKLVSDSLNRITRYFSSESRGDPEREILRVDHEPSEYGYHRRR